MSLLRLENSWWVRAGRDDLRRPRLESSRRSSRHLVHETHKCAELGPTLSRRRPITGSDAGATMKKGMASKSTIQRLYGNKDPNELPAFSLVEVAHMLWVRRKKLGRWATGYIVGGVHQPPLIKIADPHRGLLSFNNLSELHVLSALRDFEVPLQTVRKAIRHLRSEIVGPEHLHPLLALDLHTDGFDVFIEHLGELVSIARRPGQGAIREVFEAHLKRIDKDPNEGTTLRLFPFVRPYESASDAFDQPKTVTIDPLISFGRPVLAGTRVPTEELANRWSAGEEIDSIAADLNLEPTAIEEALRYQLATRAA